MATEERCTLLGTESDMETRKNITILDTDGRMKIDHRILILERLSVLDFSIFQFFDTYGFRFLKVVKMQSA